MGLNKWLSSYYKHILHCSLMCAVIIIFSKLQTSKSSIDPWMAYGKIPTIVLYFFLSLRYLMVPRAIFNFCGLILYNTFPGQVQLKDSPSKTSMISIRIVTRGDFPDLVKGNVKRNIEVCLKAGLENFIVEIVTNQPINVHKDDRVREIVVPVDYRTKSEARFKARSLQYCLDECVSELEDNDWIVHLDEETLLTEDSVCGIVNFALDGKHSFGQGLITHADLGIVNWITTLADAFRIGEDMGVFRFQFKFFHKPIFSFKGSFVVAQVKAEKEVSFENGADGSMAEDLYFGLRAYHKGYAFGWVEGTMNERSPFTVMDFLQQRKRWFQGVLLVMHSPQIPFKYKLFNATTVYSWVLLPLTTLFAIFTKWSILPSLGECFDMSCGAIDGVYTYLFMFGVVKSFPIRRLGLVKFVLSLIGSIFIAQVNLLFEVIVSIWGLISTKRKFFIIQKSHKAKQ